MPPDADDLLDGCDVVLEATEFTDDDDVHLYRRFASIVEGVHDRAQRLLILRRVRDLVDGL